MVEKPSWRAPLKLAFNLGMTTIRHFLCFLLLNDFVASKIPFSLNDFKEMSFRDPQPAEKITTGHAQKPVFHLAVSKLAISQKTTSQQTQVVLNNVFSGLQYNAEVILGSGQSFQINLDTGSADTWFRGPSCQNPSKDGSCNGTKVKIDDSAIKSLGSSWKTNYGIGSVEGQIYEGPLSLGGLTATIPFGVSTIEDGCAGTDGIMGLGYNAKGASNISESVNGKSANFWDALGFTGSQNVFGFFLSPTGNGQITLGGIDSSKIAGMPVFFKLLQEAKRGYIGWFFDVRDGTVSVNGSQVLSKLSIIGEGQSMVPIGLSDTGTSGILLPTSVVAKINSAIGARPDNEIACSIASTGPDVIFNIQQSSFAIPSSVYVYKQPGNNACQSQFLPGAEKTGAIIFGATFFQSFYGIFDKINNRVGFAQLNGSNDVGQMAKGSAASTIQSSLQVVLSFLFIRMMFFYYN